MIVVDDLLVRPFFSILNSIHALALDELYDVEAIKDDIKENELLYDLGERSETEYERRKAELEAELQVAETASEQLSGKQIQVRG